MRDFKVKCSCRPEYVFVGVLAIPKPPACPVCGSPDAQIIRCGPDSDVFEAIQAVFGPKVKEIKDPLFASGFRHEDVQVEAPDGLIYDDWYEALNH